MLYRDEGDAGRGELLDRGHELSQVPTEPIKAPRHDRINATLPAISWSRAGRRSFVREPRYPHTLWLSNAIAHSLLRRQSADHGACARPEWG